MPVTTLKLDSFSIMKTGHLVKWNSLEELQALRDEACRQEAQRFKEEYSHIPWYAEQAARDPRYWAQRARSYLPECLVSKPEESSK